MLPRVGSAQETERSIFLRAVDLPFSREKQRSTFHFFYQLFLFLAVFASYIYIAVVGAVHFEIKVTRVGSLMRSEADKFNFTLA